MLAVSLPQEIPAQPPLVREQSMLMAQIVHANDGTGTLVTPNPVMSNQLDITGGRSSAANLFHSFEQFGLNSGQIANFISSPGIDNILARVTGGNVSIINGLIQVSGGNPNLYLMNPAGIVFGAGASLNVPGSFMPTTANRIRVGDQWFNAIGDNNYSALTGQPNAIVPASDGTGTSATPNLGNPSQFDITGGRSSAGNLFHSFERFGLNSGQIANFMSNPGIDNILARVTGGTVSFINGSIQVTGGNPNLYLMNPAGIVFGAGASLNVPGSFMATTANGIRFRGGWFNAIGTNDYPALTGQPNALGFTMNQPGAIINAGSLTVGAGRNLTLVGGTVLSTEAGTLAAPGGQITLVTVPGQSFVQIINTDPSFSRPDGILRLEVRPLVTGESQPTPLTLPITALPDLLTNSEEIRNATGLSTNPDGTISLTGAGVRVENADIVVGHSLERVSVAASAQGKLVTQDIDSNFSSGAVDLSARGDIVVTTINSGEGGVRISTEGIFRATDTFTVRGVVVSSGRSEVEGISLGDDNDLVSFLISQGIPESQIRNPVTGEIIDTVVVVYPSSQVSIRADPGSCCLDSTRISIRHGGESIPGDRIDIQGAGNPIQFVSGGRGETPVASSFGVRSGSLGSFNPSLDVQPFVLYDYRGYRTLQPNEFPEGVSGAVGAISIIGTNRAIYNSLPSKPFIPVITGNSNSGLGGNGNSNVTTNGSLNAANNNNNTGNIRFNLSTTVESQFRFNLPTTVESQFNTQAKTDPCKPSSTAVVQATGGQSRSPNSSDRLTNPCAPTSSDQQILKILEELPNPGQNKELQQIRNRF